MYYPREAHTQDDITPGCTATEFRNESRLSSQEKAPNPQSQKHRSIKSTPPHDLRQVKTACGRAWGGVYAGVDGGGDAGSGE